MGIHGLLFAMLNVNSVRNADKVVELDTVEMQVLTMKTASGNPHSHSVSSVKQKTETSSMNQSLKVGLGKLVPQVKWTPEGYKERTQGTVAKGEVSDDPHEAWGVGGQDIERMTHPGLMNMVYHTVNGLTFYPGVLARKDMEGVVYARLVLLKGGACDWRKTQIRSRSRYFRVYILSVLKKSCRQNFAVQMKGLHQVNVDLAFHFEITEGPGWENMKDFNYTSGNSLMFYRNAQKSKLEWHFGPFQGMFPLPIVNVDFVWLKENWDHYVNELEAPEIRFEKEKQKELRSSY